MKTADYTLYADGSTYVIIAFDLAGNQSLSYTVTVNNGHTFTNYISDKNANCTENGNETAICDFCDATNTRQDEDSAFGHNYGEPEFIWSDDGKTCVVTFICKKIIPMLQKSMQLLLLRLKFPQIAQKWEQQHTTPQ